MRKSKIQGLHIIEPLHDQHKKLLSSLLISRECLMAIDLEDRQTDQLMSILKLVKKWDKLQSASFQFLNQSSILKNLSRIKFRDLKILNLKNNLIETLDSIRSIQAPQLQILDLSFNLITKINPIRSMVIPKIQQINLRQNFVNQFKILTELQARHLIRIIVGKLAQEQPLQGDLIFVLPKLETEEETFNASLSENDLVFKMPQIQAILCNRFVNSKDFWPIFDSF